MGADLRFVAQPACFSAPEVDAAFFCLQMEAPCLQLSFFPYNCVWGVFADIWSFFAYNWSLFTYNWSFLTYSKNVSEKHLNRPQAKNSTVSRKNYDCK